MLHELSRTEVYTRCLSFLRPLTEFGNHAPLHDELLYRRVAVEARRPRDVDGPLRDALKPRRSDVGRCEGQLYDGEQGPPRVVTAR